MKPRPRSAAHSGFVIVGATRISPPSCSSVRLAKAWRAVCTRWSKNSSNSAVVAASAGREPCLVMATEAPTGSAATWLANRPRVIDFSEGFQVNRSSGTRSRILRVAAISSSNSRINADFQVVLLISLFCGPGLFAMMASDQRSESSTILTEQLQHTRELSHNRLYESSALAYRAYPVRRQRGHLQHWCYRLGAAILSHSGSGSYRRSCEASLWGAGGGKRGTL